MITSSSLPASQGAPHRPYNYVSAAYLLLPLWGAAKTQRPAAALYAPTILTRCGCLQAYSLNGASYACLLRCISDAESDAGGRRL